MLYIEHDDDGGCFRLIDDDVGLCTSKSRNVLVRVRDALNAVRATGLIGLTVENTKDTVPSRIDGFPRAVVVGQTSECLIVRKPDNMLERWLIVCCRIVEPERPTRDTPGNEPLIGVRAACVLLKLWLEARGDSLDDVRHATRTFLKAREAAEPTP